jgi:hypothetical protein
MPDSVASGKGFFIFFLQANSRISQVVDNKMVGRRKIFAMNAQSMRLQPPISGRDDTRNRVRSRPEDPRAQEAAPVPKSC